LKSLNTGLLPQYCETLAISEKMLRRIQKKKTTTSQLQVKANLSQDLNYLENTFTLCGHQCQSIARQMGLFEEDSVEASSKPLNVGSTIKIEGIRDR
jgi:hypothetical protein